MQPTPIKRRSFLGYMLLLIALIRCKKDTLITKKTTTPPPPPPIVTDAYLGQYSTTEVGSNLQAAPDYMSAFNGYTGRQSYLPGDTVDLYLSDPTGSTSSITLKDAQKNAILTLPVAVKSQSINSTKPWVEGFLYEKTMSLVLPVNLKSGIYTINNTIPVIVRGTGVSYDLTVVYNSNTLNAYNFAGYLIFRGYAPFIDGRVELYGNEFVTEYFALDRFPALLDRYHIGWTIFEPLNPRNVMLDQMPGWVRAYADGDAVIHVRQQSSRTQ